MFVMIVMFFVNMFFVNMFHFSFILNRIFTNLEVEEQQQQRYV